MKLITAVLAALALAGCAGQTAMQYQGMSAEQINAAAKDNKAVFQCADFEVPSVGGGTLKSKVRSMVIDSGTVRYGKFKATTCDDIEFTNDNKPPAAAATVTTTTKVTP